MLSLEFANSRFYPSLDAAAVTSAAGRDCTVIVAVLSHVGKVFFGVIAVERKNTFLGDIDTHIFIRTGIDDQTGAAVSAGGFHYPGQGHAGDRHHGGSTINTDGGSICIGIGVLKQILVRKFTRFAFAEEGVVDLAQGAFGNIFMSAAVLEIRLEGIGVLRYFQGNRGFNGTQVGCVGGSLGLDGLIAHHGDDDGRQSRDDGDNHQHLNSCKALSFGLFCHKKTSCSQGENH